MIAGLDLASDGPSLPQVQAALDSLPDGLAAIGQRLLAAPGIVSDHVLWVADAIRAGAQEMDAICRGDRDARDWRRLSDILADAAPLFPHPARLPAAPLDLIEDADTRLRRHAHAAGLCLAEGLGR